jgi:hypothetical protein
MNYHHSTVKIALALAAVGLALSAVSAQQKVTLIGLEPAVVEQKIGPPDDKDELADSDEVYWIYKTAFGTLSIHFQNHVVVSYSPEDFPLEKIVKQRHD